MMPPLSASALSNLLLLLVILCGILVLALAIVVARLRALAVRLQETEFQNRSLSSTYGRITEQWFPLMASYPYDSDGFRFLGSPIDGVQFEEDRVVFVEFKANRSRLSPSQKRIKRLIQEGYVYWEEFHFTDDRRAHVESDDDDEYD